MNKPPRKHGHNVVQLAVKKKAVDDQPVCNFAKTGVARNRPDGVRDDDARVQEAMRLAQAFLAIEDAAARGALIALAERLVSYDWVRKVP
ncbi:MAG: hypothetical protein PSV22_17340 [Pseudolabrys sp.]|nr:hypothetical protein [Pseudolabrys sp.]